MPNQRPTSIDPTSINPAHQRLTRRDARRGLRVVGGLATALAAIGFVVRFLADPDATVTLFSGLIAAILVVGLLVIDRGPGDWLDWVAGALATTGVVATLGFVLLGPLQVPTLSVGFIGIIPIAIALFALWDLRAHLAWLAASSVAMVAIMALGSGESAMGIAAIPLAAGWILGGAVSIVSQQSLERGRRATFAAAEAAHANRDRGRAALRQLRAVEALGRALSEHGPTPETLEAAMRLLMDEFGYAFPSIFLGDDQLVRVGAQLGYTYPEDEIPRSEGIIGRVMRTRQPALVADVTMDPDYIEACPIVRSELAVPLLAGDRFLGVLNIENDELLGPDDLASISIIADRFAAALALADRHGELRTVLESSPVPIVAYDADDRVTYWSAAATRTFGWTAAEMVGRRAAIIPRDDPISADITARAARGEQVVGVETERLHRDGTPIPVRIIASPYGDRVPFGMIAVYQDLTAEHAAASALVESERRVSSVLEQASDPILGVAPDGAITFANARVTEVLGYAPEELVGRPVELLVPDAVVDAHVGLRTSYMEHPAARPMGIGRDLVARHRDGTLVPVEIAINPVRTPSGQEVYATIVDTTERRRIEAELLQAAKMDSIGRLAGGIAHDFNNLLTAIIGYGRIALTELPSEEPARADVDEMVLAAERAADLTRQLLGFARKTALVPATHDLNAIVAGLEPFLRRLLGERVALVTSLGAGTGHIRVDRAQVDQILVNLAVNARDAMPDGGTLVIATTALDPAEVDGVLELGGERIAALTVSDTGTGMSEAVRARAFEPFFTTKPFGEGTGLGLATTYGIVRQSGGAITIESAPGAGTTFRIYFSQVPAGEADAPPEPRPVSEARADRTVLVVEDEESVRTLVARMLERLGYRVFQAPNGAAALSLVGSRLPEVDLLLTDVVMPGMRGTELAAVMRGARPDLPVAFMSGYAEGEDTGGVIPEGSTLLTKPFSIEQLGAVLAALLPSAVAPLG